MKKHALHLLHGYEGLVLGDGLDAVILHLEGIHIRLGFYWITSYLVILFILIPRSPTWLLFNIIIHLTKSILITRVRTIHDAFVLFLIRRPSCAVMPFTFVMPLFNAVI